MPHSLVICIQLHIADGHIFEMRTRRTGPVVREIGLLLFAEAALERQVFALSCVDQLLCAERSAWRTADEYRGCKDTKKEKNSISINSKNCDRTGEGESAAREMVDG